MHSGSLRKEKGQSPPDTQPSLSGNPSSQGSPAPSSSPGGTQDLSLREHATCSQPLNPSPLSSQAEQWSLEVSLPIRSGRTLSFSQPRKPLGINLLLNADLGGGWGGECDQTGVTPALPPSRQPKAQATSGLQILGSTPMESDKNPHLSRPKMCVCMRAQLLQSCPTLCDPMDCSSPGSSVHGGFSRQEYWSGLPCCPPGDLPDSGIKPASPVSPALQADSSPLS